MISIAKNAFYQISLDKKKNRIYMKMCGTWDSNEQVPQYLHHVKAAIRELDSGFSVVTDIRELDDYSIDLHDVQIRAQRLLMEGGIYQLAEIHNGNDPMTDLAIALAYKSKISLNIFERKADAEAWLDESLE